MSEKSDAAYKIVDDLLLTKGHRALIEAIAGHSNDCVPGIAASALAELIDNLAEAIQVVSCLAEADRAHVIEEYLRHISTAWHGVRTQMSRNPRSTARHLALAEDAGHATGPDMLNYLFARINEEQTVPRRPATNKVDS
jgi:hypothetical protein